jgi:hypothetical protein
MADALQEGPMLRRARWCGLAILLGIFGGRGGPNPARADDEPEAPAPATEEPLELQWDAVGVLTAGRTDFAGPRGPFPLPRTLRRPRFWARGGVHQALRNHHRHHRPRPARDPRGRVGAGGVSIAGKEPGRSVYGPPGDPGRIEKVLLELEREALRTVTLDAVVVRGDPSTAVGPRGFADAVTRGTLAPVSGARAIGKEDQVVAARTEVRSRTWPSRTSRSPSTRRAQTRSWVWCLMGSPSGRSSRP